MSIIDIYKYNNNAEVLKIIDGDTLNVLTDFGCCKIKQKLRLLRIDTPEKFANKNDVNKINHKNIGLDVKNYLKKLINESNNIIRVEAKGCDVYGRVLCECYLSNGVNISDHFLENKLCKPCSGVRNEWTEDDYIIANENLQKIK